jgi:hypothetical protein
MLVGIAIEIPFAIGEGVLGIEAFIVRWSVGFFPLTVGPRDWRTLQMVAYLPMLGEAANYCTTGHLSR